jgi:hypothetical protein
MKSSNCFAVLITLALGAGVSAQSLADVARAEETRRKSIKPGAKVYTNENLGSPLQTSAPPADAASASNAAKPADAKPEEQKAVDPTKTEKYWKDRASAIQESLSRLRLLLDALQTQESGLNAEYLSMDDPGHRGLLETRMHRATLERQRVQQDIEKQTKAAADLHEEARKSGIPAGWVR